MYKPKDAKLFGAALKRLLHEKGLSDRQFAKRAGLPQSHISKLVNPMPGKEIAEPRKKTRQKLAQGLGITEQELLEQIAQYSDSEAEKTISTPPGLVETEEAIAKPQRESEQPDTSSIEERIFRATEQLNSRGFSALVGIQALEEIAKDSPRYHWKIMELLAAFVRENAPRKEEEEGEEKRSPKIPDDIQAALTVIKRRDIEKDPPKQRLNLSNTDIRGADLSQGKLHETNFNGANLQGANLSRAQLQKANFTEANLKETDLKGANLQEANLWQAVLKRAILWGANLEKAILMKTDLSWAAFDGSSMRGAELHQANLKGADLQGVNFCEADLSGADLREVELGSIEIIEDDKLNEIIQVNLEGTVFYRANLKGTDLSAAKNLNSEQIKGAYGDSTTVLPESVGRPAHWM